MTHRLLTLFLIALFLFITVPSLLAQPPDTLWTRYWDRGDGELANSINATADNGFVIAGSGRLNGATNRSGWVGKTNSQGQLDWEWMLTGDDHDAGAYVEQTQDGGYIVGAATHSYSPDLSYACAVIKLNAAGEEQWMQVISDHLWDDGLACVRELPDGDFIATGNLGGDPMLWRLGPDGETRWVDTYPLDISWVLIYFVEPLSDGSFVMTGIFRIGPAQRMGLLKVDADHQFEWVRYYPADLELNGSAGYCVRETYDGNIVVCGYIWPEVYEEYQDWCLMKVDLNGDIIWQKIIHGTSSEIAYSFVETPQHDLVVGGLDQEDGGYNLYNWLVKTDSEGEIQWQSWVLGGWMYSICQSTDGGFGGTGEVNYIEEPRQFFMVKWEDDGSSSVSTHQPVAIPHQFTLAAYPNPFNASTTITLSLPTPGRTHVLVYNSLGQQVATLADTRLAAGEHTFPFDATGLASGVYVIRVMSQGQVEQTQKVVLVR